MCFCEMVLLALVQSNSFGFQLKSTSISGQMRFELCVLVLDKEKMHINLRKAWVSILCLENVLHFYPLKFSCRGIVTHYESHKGPLRHNIVIQIFINQSIKIIGP